MRLARHRRLQIVARLADRQIGRRVADLLQVLQVPVRVPRLALGRRAKQRRDVVLSFHVGLRGEVQVAPVGLAFAGKRVSYNFV